jgi:glycosyltransferase involved in cell wall biosynthesis
MSEELLPQVSVIMPIYRENPFYGQAISSILAQTCTPLELIVICDEPTEAARKDLEGFRDRDNRVVLRFNTPGIGLVGSRNTGIRLARGRYLNPMDSDDVSRPERLERQVAFLDSHPEIGLLGTGIEYIDGRGDPVRSVEAIMNPASLKWALFFENPFCQSSVLIRRQILDQSGWYDEARPLAEDYDLWIRLAAVTGIRILPQVLMQYRVHESNISAERKTALDRESSDLNSTLIGRYFEGFSDDDIAAFQHLFLRQDLPSKTEVQRLRSMLESMLSEFIQRERPSEQEVREILRHLGLQYLILAYLSRQASPHQALGLLRAAFRCRRGLPIDILRIAARKSVE